MWDLWRAWGWGHMAGHWLVWVLVVAVLVALVVLLVRVVGGRSAGRVPAETQGPFKLTDLELPRTSLGRLVAAMGDHLGVGYHVAFLELDPTPPEAAEHAAAKVVAGTTQRILDGLGTDPAEVITDLQPAARLRDIEHPRQASYEVAACFSGTW